MSLVRLPFMEHDTIRYDTIQSNLSMWITRLSGYHLSLPGWTQCQI